MGQRHKGTAVVLKIASMKMWYDRFQFFLSRNYVWLTETVPPNYIEIINKPTDGNQ